MTDLKILAKNLKRFRLLRGMKQTELASKIGMTPQYFSKIEVAKTPNIGVKYLIAICRELNIELFQLFMENGDTVHIQFIVGKENLNSLERVLDKISKRVDIRFKKDPTEKPVFYHPQDCGCEKCKQKGGEKNGNDKGN